LLREEGEMGSVVGKRMLMGFSQWVGSEKLRRDTGWTDRRMVFSEGIEQYRIAYEAAVEKGDEGLAKIPKKKW
jgi:hypothetical protein